MKTVPVKVEMRTPCTYYLTCGDLTVHLAAFKSITQPGFYGFSLCFIPKCNNADTYIRDSFFKRKLRYVRCSKFQSVEQACENKVMCVKKLLQSGAFLKYLTKW